MGRKATTGRFDTRDKLVEKIIFLYYETDCNMSQIGRNVGINGAAVSKIIDEYSYLKDYRISCE